MPGQRRFLWFLAMLSYIALAGVLVALIWPYPPDPLMDAERNVLAVNAQQGYCSGYAFWQKTGASGAEECREGEGAAKSTVRNLDAVVSNFCKGAQDAGWNGNAQTGCVDVLEASRLWPGVDGILTNAWSRQHPYPGDDFGQAPPGESDRGTSRDGFAR